mgnify:CR=1 FL=1
MPVPKWLLQVTRQLAVALCCGIAEAQPPAEPAPPVASPEQPAARSLRLPAAPDLTVTTTETPRPLIFADAIGRALGAAIECPTCAGTDRWAPSPTSNAPWSAGVSVNVSLAGTAVGLAVMGSRNYRMPRYMAQPLGSTSDTTPPGASAYSDLASNRTEWIVSARVRRTLKTFSGGQTLGVVADGWLPLTSLFDPARLRSNLPPPAPRTDVPLLPSKAIRAGVSFGF